MIETYFLLEALKLANRADLPPEVVIARADSFVNWLETKAIQQSGSSKVVDSSKTPDELGTSQKTITLAKSKKSG